MEEEVTPRQTAQTKNHPAPGSIITVQPIIDKKVIERIKDHLKDHPRNYALFVTGINTAFRASDLLTLKVGDVRGDTIRRREIKTGKVREFYLNGAVKSAVAPLIEGRDDGDFLFRSEMTGYALTVEAFSTMVKIWCFNAGLKGNFASHTLRKTWARDKVDSGEPVWKVSEALGHSSEKITRLYLGLQVEDMKTLYMREL
jgi:integrase